MCGPQDPHPPPEPRILSLVGFSPLVTVLNNKPPFHPYCTSCLCVWQYILSTLDTTIADRLFVIVFIVVITMGKQEIQRVIPGKWCCVCSWECHASETVFKRGSYSLDHTKTPLFLSGWLWCCEGVYKFFQLVFICLVCLEQVTLRDNWSRYT